MTGSPTENGMMKLAAQVCEESFQVCVHQSFSTFMHLDSHDKDPLINITGDTHLTPPEGESQ